MYYVTTELNKVILLCALVSQMLLFPVAWANGANSSPSRTSRVVQPNPELPRPCRVIREKEQLLRQNSISRDPEFMKYLSAIMWVESGGREDAVSNRGAMGIMQVTQPAADHTVRLCPALYGRSTKHIMGNLMLSSTNIQIASCYLQHARVVSGSWVGALVMYNSGYRGLTQLNNNARVPTETAQYVVSVLNTINQCY